MRTLLLFISILVAQTAIAQGPRFSSSLDTAMIRIGEQTYVHLKAEGIQDPEALKWPIITDTLHRAVEVIQVDPVDTISSEDGFSLDLQILITSWDSGYYAIRPLQLNYDGKDYQTEALLLSVNTVAVDTSAAPVDIKPIYEEPFSFKDWIQMNWPYVLAVAILIGLIFLILRMKRKGEIDVFGPAPVQVIPAHELAWTRLESLKNKEPGELGKKAYYSELTETLRSYLEDRYRVKALEQTSAEILESVRYTGMDAGSMDYLRSLLLTADMVKFAKESPGSQVMENHLERAFEFIARTKREEVVEEEDE